MNLFINDIPLTIVDAAAKPDKRDFNIIINGEIEPITKARLLHRVWIKNGRQDEIDHLLDLLDTTKMEGLISITITVTNYEQIKEFLKKKFKIIRAAGGLVKKKDKVLMIYRLKKWDLPKGKLNKREKNKTAAKREVEEECNITVEMEDKLCTTWHTYTMKKKKILKKTVWYEMKVKKHSKMKPQIEEDIEEVRWMTPKEAFHALEHSYKSIGFVFDRYFSKQRQMEIEAAEAAATAKDQSSE